MNENSHYYISLRKNNNIIFKLFYNNKIIIDFVHIFSLIIKEFTDG